MEPGDTKRSFRVASSNDHHQDVKHTDIRQELEKLVANHEGLMFLRAASWVGFFTDVCVRNHLVKQQDNRLDALKNDFECNRDVSRINPLTSCALARCCHCPAHYRSTPFEKLTCLTAQSELQNRK